MQTMLAPHEFSVVIFAVLVLLLATSAFLLFIRVLPAPPLRHQRQALRYFSAFFLTVFAAFLLYCLRYADQLILSATLNNTLYLLATYLFYLGARHRHQQPVNGRHFGWIGVHLGLLSALMYWFSAIEPDAFWRLPLSLLSFCLPVLLTFSLLRQQGDRNNPGDKVLLLCALLALLVLPLMFPLFAYLLSDNPQGQLLTMAMVTLALETLCIGGLAISYIHQLTARLRADAHTDQLTQCRNRRYFFKAIGRYQQQVAAGEPVSLVLADIDHFKQLNDEHGHQVGDVVLRYFAATLQAKLNPADLVVRYGGEEFLLVLPGRSLQQAADWLSGVQQQLATQPCQTAGVALRVRASFGVAMLGKDDIDRNIQQADQALYQAKAAGRDQVVLAQTLTDKPADAPVAVPVDVRSETSRKT